MNVIWLSSTRKESSSFGGAGSFAVTGSGAGVCFASGSPAADDASSRHDAVASCSGFLKPGHSFTNRDSLLALWRGGQCADRRCQLIVPASSNSGNVTQTAHRFLAVDLVDADFFESAAQVATGTRVGRRQRLGKTSIGETDLQVRSACFADIDIDTRL